MQRVREAHPPHAPERGWSHRLLGRFHVTGVFWYRFHRWGVAFLPQWGVGAFVMLFTTFFFLTLWRIRRALAENLVPVLGPCRFFERQARIYRTMWSFAWCLSERYERLATDRRFTIEIDHERWNELTRQGQGFILVTAHVGNYEVGSMLPATQREQRVIVVREKEVDEEAQAFIQELLEQAGHAQYVSHFEEEDPSHALTLLAALRGGAIVGMQGDRPRAGGPTVSRQLFGRPFELPSGPAALARAAGVVLVPAFVFRVERLHYRVEIGEPIPVQRTEDRDTDLRNATSRIGDAIESAIRRHPHQWFCFRSVFRNDPQSL
ncbi:MAG: lysophospholipid acyltransferase family protein [Thermoanaerobaculia bacterium]